MIAVTGPGRAGTTFLALLYRELGFDPGGQWRPQFRAGFEDSEFRRLNMALAEELNLTVEARSGPKSLLKLERLRAEHADQLPNSLNVLLTRWLDSIRYRPTTLETLDWTNFEGVVERHGEQMRALAARTQVVKDTRLNFTLHAWLASGASIDHLVVPLRRLDSMVDSRVRVEMFSTEGRMWWKNNFAYGVGLVVTAASEYRIPLVLLRFPDFLDSPRELYAKLPLPEPRSWEDFERAFAQVYDPSMVNDRC
jgi:hypothetical protein